MPDSDSSTNAAGDAAAARPVGTDLDATASTALPEGAEVATDRFDAIPDGRGLREHTARGTIINASFNIGLVWVGLLRRFLVAAFLTAAEYGLWGLLVVALSTVVFLKEVGISDKYIQQDEQDQERAFQKAFTLEAIFSVGIFLVALAALPLFALLYGEPDMIFPGAIFALALPLSVLSFPRIVFYRRMQYARQRVLEAIDPIVGIVVTLGLGAAGAGYWSLVLGVIAGALAAGVVTTAMSPYPLRFRYDRETLGQYFNFSWPLLVSQGSGLLTVQASMLAGKASVGLAGLGLIGVAGQFSILADRVGVIVTRTLYPAICAVADRLDLLHESFVKSNRLGLMWAVPFGLGLTLFGADIVHVVLGDRWTDAIPLIQVFGAVVAVEQIGFNWTAFMRARGETRPIAVVGVGGLVVSVALVVPALLVWGLDGYMWSQLGRATVMVVWRGYYLRRMFRGFSLARHAVRAIAPAVPAVGVVLALRLATGDGDAMALFQLAAYVLATAGFTWLFERDLLRELRGYLRRRVPTTTQPAAT